MSPCFRIPKRSGLVVVYYGADPHHHRRSPADPRRPACQPIRPPGLLAHQKQAEKEGTSPCPECWPENEKNHD